MTAPCHEQFLRSADGLRLHVRCHDGPRPDAPVVLCLHGLTRTCRDFEDLAPRLQRHYRVLAPDLRGRGLSDRDPQPGHYQPAQYLQDLLALLPAVGATRYAVIGTSLGGLLAMMLAATQPAQVAGIVLNDIGPEIDPAGVERIRQYAGRMAPVADWAQAVAQAQQVYGAAWPGLDQACWQRLARRGYREDAQGVPRIDADPMIGEAFRGAPRAALELWPLWSAQRDVPVLAIRGALSDILSRATLARMQREKPDLETLEIAQRGHVPLLDEPGCVERIEAFLARLRF
ncbi:MAG TPA: alpha/beta hydrolase [Steroidobacteraceae bacterium]|nr:alpha/beta hydrolase [Steroidobacteraceae bacterium]